MKDLIYPAVLYKDKETGWYTIAIHDLGIVTQGETVENAYVNAKDYLSAMCECAVKFECEIDAPSPFIDVWNKNKGSIVLLIDAQM